ncbi:tetratricopeptide repeat protein [Thiotrichales bacterium 19S3-7]|nr:tetratricopeptide repeat protein [Thiotrichales bacterium 19S3-7]MCF6802668.1 tetratricopeptide repeat protein [Thiotrichales bacterium 19S3-11]
MKNVQLITQNYRYLDQGTWSEINDVILYVDQNIHQLLENETKWGNLQTVVNTGLVCALHLIWNQKDAVSLKRAQHIVSSISSVMNLAITNYFMAKLNYVQGNFNDALDYYQIAMSLNKIENDQQAYSNRNILLAMGSISENNSYMNLTEVLSAVIFNDMANVYVALEQYDQALANFNCAYDIQSDIYEDKESPNIAYTLRNMAKAYLGKEDLINAKIQSDIAYTITQKIYDDRHPEHTETQSINQKINELCYS